MNLLNLLLSCPNFFGGGKDFGPIRFVFVFHLRHLSYASF